MTGKFPLPLRFALLVGGAALAWGVSIGAALLFASLAAFAAAVVAEATA
jgi:hypothetical protein